MPPSSETRAAAEALLLELHSGNEAEEAPEEVVAWAAKLAPDPVFAADPRLQDLYGPELMQAWLRYPHVTSEQLDHYTGISTRGEGLIERLLAHPNAAERTRVDALWAHGRETNQPGPAATDAVTSAASALVPAAIALSCQEFHDTALQVAAEGREHTEIVRTLLADRARAGYGRVTNRGVLTEVLQVARSVTAGR